MLRHVVAWRDAIHHHVRRGCTAVAANAQYAHIALMSEQLGYDRAKGLVVTGYFYNDHRQLLVERAARLSATSRGATAFRRNRSARDASCCERRRRATATPVAKAPRWTTACNRH